MDCILLYVLYTVEFGWKYQSFKRHWDYSDTRPVGDFQFSSYCFQKKKKKNTVGTIKHSHGTNKKCIYLILYSKRFIILYRTSAQNCQLDIVSVCISLFNLLYFYILEQYAVLYQ